MGLVGDSDRLGDGLQAILTMPMFSKMPLTTHMIQPDMLTMRITRPVARAMAPTVISD